MNSTIKTAVFWLVIAGSAFLLWQVVKGGQNGQKIPEISYSEFLSQVESGNISKVTISKSQITGRYQNNEDSFRLTAPTSQEGMLQILRQKNVEIWFRNTADEDWPTRLMNLAPLVLLAALWVFMMRQMKLRQTQTQTNKQP